MIWRYMPYALYVQLIGDRELRFTRLDKFRDQHEGLPRPAYGFDNLGCRGIPPTPAPIVHQTHVAASCWCRSDIESVSLWERYAGPHGIAIKTTVARLSESLRLAPRDVFIHNAIYTSRSSDCENGHELALRKPPAYSDEREVRAVIRSQNLRPEGYLPESERQEVDVLALIAEVVVGPPWQSWFTEHVRKVSAMFGVPEGLVKRSTILDRSA